MLERAQAAGVALAWVSGDTVYGNDRRLRGWLEENYQAYVLAVACTERVWIDGSEGPTQVAVEKVIAEQPIETWQRLSCGQGSKGPLRVRLDKNRTGIWAANRLESMAVGPSLTH